MNRLLQYFVLLAFLAVESLCQEETEHQTIQEKKIQAQEVKKKLTKQTKNIGSSVTVILFVMTLNNYLEGKLKVLRERYPTFGKFVQPASLNTILGILLGKFFLI